MSEVEKFSDNDLKTALQNHRKYVVLGISANPARASYGVTEFMISHGYDVIGVNPGQTEVLGRPCYPSLADAFEAHPEYFGMINVFRASESIPDVVEEVLKLPVLPKTLWIQLGITHPKAEDRARKAGVSVISDRCLKIEFRRLLNKS
jgi:predicted CoA-binding protein